jgi:hypothetical protein
VDPLDLALGDDPLGDQVAPLALAGDAGAGPAVAGAGDDGEDEDEGEEAEMMIAKGSMPRRITGLR